MNLDKYKFYDKNGITLYCADNMQILPHLQNIDLIITSPPYNLQVTTGGGFPKGDYIVRSQKRTGIWDGGNLANGYDTYADARSPEEYKAWQREFLKLAWQALSSRGAIFYNHKPRVQGNEVQLPLEYNPGLPLRQIIIWKRAGGVNFTQTYYLPTHEWILLFAQKDFRLKSQSISGVGDVWEFMQEQHSDHPAPFPVTLPARIIDTVIAEVICDPYAGSGTTLKAAQDAGKRAIGIEISENYAKMCVERLSQQSLFSINKPEITQLKLT